MCAPGTDVDTTFAGRPTLLREIYDRIQEYVVTLGPVHEDAVGVGVFLKAGRTLAEVRPGSRDVALVLWLPRPVDGEAAGTGCVLAVRADRVAVQVTLRSAADVDDVRDWLTCAYLAAAGPGTSAGR